MGSRGPTGRPLLAAAALFAAAAVPAPAQDALRNLEADLLAVVDRVRPAVVGIQVERTFPHPAVSLSGVCVDREGGVATVGFPLAGAERISVRLHDGRSFRARLAGVGSDRRVALLRVEGVSLPSLPLGDAAHLRAGSLVVTLGAPLGFPGTVALGCVSGLDLEAPPYAGLFQTTVPVREGDVGGVVADVRGEIVGMVVGSVAPAAIFRVGGAPAGPEAPAGVEEGARISSTLRLSIATPAGEKTLSPPAGLALPIGRVLEEARALAEAESPSPVVEKRRWLGVSVEDEFEPALRAQLGLGEGEGLLVRRVYEGSPASRSGIEPFDVLLEVGEEAVGTIAALRRRLEALSPGGVLELELLRHGRRVRISVTVE